MKLLHKFGHAKKGYMFMIFFTNPIRWEFKRPLRYIEICGLRFSLWWKRR